MLSRKFPVDLVAMGLVDANRTSFCLIVELSLLDQGCNKVIDGATLRYKDFEYLLHYG